MPKPFFNSENAKMFGAKGNLIRWSHKPEPESLDSSVGSTEGIADDYQSKVLARTRAQLNKVLAEVDVELDKKNLDHKRLKELALVQNILAEQERKLSMRPDPGTVKAGKTKSERRRGSFQPSPAKVQPVAKPPVQQPETPQHIDYCGSDFPSV